ncbi:MAG: trypsin-like peptidase domain-containing protein [Pseudonocardiaceae bacterium]
MVASLWRAALVGLSVSTAALLGVAPAPVQPAAPPVPVGENPLQAPAQERAAALARPAIVYIKEKFTAYVFLADGILINKGWNSGKPFEIDATCTGFGVNPAGYIATAGHCVDITSRYGIKYDIVALIAAQIHETYPSFDVQKFITSCLDNCTMEGQLKGSPPDSEISVVGGATVDGSTQAQARPARVVEFRPFGQGDVALLKVDATDQPSIELAQAAQVQIGTPVLSIGYPGDTAQVTDPSLEPTNKDGQVSSKRTVDSGPVYEISAALTKGMSGGPTIGLDGLVLGLNSFKAPGETQPFNFIAPAGGLSELLNRNGVHNQLGPNDVTYRQGLADYFSGHYTSAIADFDKLLAVSPNQPQALQYKALAAKVREQFGDVQPPGPGVLRWVLIGIAGLLVLAAVATVPLLRQRGRHRRAESLGPLALDAVPGGVLPDGSAPRWVPSGPVYTGPLVVNPVAESPVPTATAEAAWPAARAGSCSNCGTARTPDARFCPHCGIPQS